MTSSAPRVSLGEGVRTFLRDRYLSVDVRWLGIFRLALGALLMVEVLRRWYYAVPFYTNDGLLPNHYSLFAPMGGSVFSIYHAFSTYPEVSLAFFATLLVFITFTLGYRTRLFHLLSAVCITSLNARNLFVQNGGTVVVNLLTVYTLFLPLGARFSIDAVRGSLRRRLDWSVLDLNRPDPLRKPVRTSSFVVLLFLVQWSAIYFFNTVHKDGEGWRNGTALHWFFHQDRIATAFSIWAREHLPLSVVKTMTYGTLVVEGALSVLLLVPFFQTSARRIVLVLVWILHGIIALSARLGPFSYAMMLFPLLLLGADDFAFVTRRFRNDERRVRVVIDGASPSVFAVARVLDRLDPFDRLTFVDRRETDELPAKAPRDPLWVLDRNGSILRREHAWFALLKALPFGILFAVWFRLPGTRTIAKRICRAFEARHAAFGRALGVERPALEPALARPVELLPETPFRLAIADAGRALREAAVVLLGIAVVSAILHDNRFVPASLKPRRAEWMVKVIEYPRLLQGWSMFAPEPPYEDGRVVVDGRTADGRKLDPFSGGEPNFDTTTARSWDHEQFWCDYHNYIRFSGNEGRRQFLRHYLLHQHERSGRPEDRLVAFDVWWVQDRSPPPGALQGEPLAAEKLLSHGRMQDSGAAPNDPLQAGLRRRGQQVPLHGP
jgi:predicted DCC family thiol-disulfide oxidoreductase YuxK